MIRQCLIIFLCLAVGEVVVWLTHIPIPSSIIGLLLLTALLQMGIVKKDWVKGISDFLISNLGFFFVPAGVALMLHFDLIRCHWLPITVATVVSTVVVLIITGLSHQFFEKHGNIEQ